MTPLPKRIRTWADRQISPKLATFNPILKNLCTGNRLGSPQSIYFLIEIESSDGSRVFHAVPSIAFLFIDTARLLTDKPAPQSSQANHRPQSFDCSTISRPRRHPAIRPPRVYKRSISTVIKQLLDRNGLIFRSLCFLSRLPSHHSRVTRIARFCGVNSSKSRLSLRSTLTSCTTTAQSSPKICASSCFLWLTLPP